MDVKTRLLNAMFERELYPKKQTFNLLVHVIEKGYPESDVMEEIINKTNQQLLGHFDFHEILEGYHYKPADNPVIAKEDFCEQKIDLRRHYVMNGSQKAFLKVVSKYMRVPTEYLTPKGTITVDYDTDALKTFSCNDDIFYDHLRDFNMIIQRSVFIDHFIF
jgi:hypothetical protein